MHPTTQCPNCKKQNDVTFKEVAGKPLSAKCCECNTISPPDIMTAYQNIGKTMRDLKNCCNDKDKK